MSPRGGVRVAAIMCSLTLVLTCAAVVAFMGAELYGAEVEEVGNPVTASSSVPSPVSEEGDIDSAPAQDSRAAVALSGIYPSLSGHGVEAGLGDQTTPATGASVPQTGVAPVDAQVSKPQSTQVAKGSGKLSIFQRAKCYPLSFPDILDINQCLNGSASFCVTTKKGFRSVLRQIARCCVKALATANFGLIVLRVLRDVLIVSLRVLFPVSTRTLIPLLIKMRKRFRKQESQATILFTSRPCNETVDIYFPDFLGVADCIRPDHFMCTKTGDVDLLPTQALTSLLLAAVCILKKLPFFKPFTIIWQLICSAFEFVQMTFGKTPNSFFYAASEMGQLIFQCKIKNILPAGVQGGQLLAFKVFS